jgi:hypothetical protein
MATSCACFFRDKEAKRVVCGAGPATEELCRAATELQQSCRAATAATSLRLSMRQ